MQSVWMGALGWTHRQWAACRLGTSIIDALASLSPKTHIKKGVSGSPYWLSLCETLMCTPSSADNKLKCSSERGDGKLNRLDARLAPSCLLWQTDHILTHSQCYGAWRYWRCCYLIVWTGRNVVKDLTGVLGWLNGLCELCAGTLSIMQGMTALPLFPNKH